MTSKVAVVFCVHHKPWLIMSTLITLAAQQDDDVELHFLYQVGDGHCEGRPSYEEYHRLEAECGSDPQLSPYDERVRTVTEVGWPSRATCLENDGALDSGAWYKFIRSGMWEKYDYVLFLGEGSLLTRRGSLRAMVDFARSRDVHCIAGGHEKRRMPKQRFLCHYSERRNATPLDRFHDRMTRSVFELFSRDRAFGELLARWSSEFAVETQDHVPDIWGPLTSMRDRVNRSGVDDDQRGVRNVARRAFLFGDGVASRAAIAFGRAPGLRPSTDDRVYVDRMLHRASEVVGIQHAAAEARFHLEPGPEWFGAATNHLMSRTFLARFADKLESFDLYDAVDLPFAGTALEVVWGFVPEWLGFQKWFTDAIHRVRKHFVTYRREDDPDGMASYINRYFLGVLHVTPDSGDFVKIRHFHRSLESVRSRLPAHYFA